jgi:OOP family OmpA-OmpF porin
VRVRLSGSLEAGATFVGFSELIGEGAQEPIAMVDYFDGVWDPRAGVLELHQEGPVVTGCADDGRKTLNGTVTGNLLRATLIDNTSGTRGAVILSRTAEGSLRGLRSDNGAPFYVFEGPVAAEGVTTHCSTAPAPVIGCGAILHGITFDYDSAAIRGESGALLDALFAGIQGIDAAAIEIVGHTSSEGTESYNQDLSERRAAAVVAALQARGTPAGRLTSGGRGESEPIADNGTETGRSLNRRVEVRCGGADGGAP